MKFLRHDTIRRKADSLSVLVQHTKCNSISDLPVTKAREQRYQPSDSVKSMLIAVFLPILPDMAAPGPRVVQPGPVGAHARGGPGQAVLLLGD